MSTRFLSAVVLTFLVGGFLAGCFSVMGPIGGSEDADKRAIGGQPNPAYRDNIFFDFDETGPASSTLAMYPTVVTWRLKLNVDIPVNTFLAGDAFADTQARIWGWDAAGNVVANGRLTMIFEDLENATSTMQVSGQSLDLEESGILIEAIAFDLDASLAKAGWGCWGKFFTALGAVAGFIAASTAAVGACATVPVGLPACVLAIIKQIGLGAAAAVKVLDYLCSCIDGYAELNPDLCGIEA